MAKARSAKKPKVDELESASQVKHALPSQRYPASCPGCGTNSRILVYNEGNSLDCDNCGTTYKWS